MCAAAPRAASHVLGAPLEYGKRDTANPFFVAFGKLRGPARGMTPLPVNADHPSTLQRPGRVTLTGTLSNDPPPPPTAGGGSVFGVLQVHELFG